MANEELRAALEACPFCGNESPYFERMGTSRQSCIVACGNCGCRHESSDEGSNSGRQWNERAALPACDECGKTSTPDGMWALYCVECIETKIGPALFPPTKGAGAAHFEPTDPTLDTDNWRAYKADITPACKATKGAEEPDPQTMALARQAVKASEETRKLSPEAWAAQMMDGLDMHPHPDGLATPSQAAEKPECLGDPGECAHNKACMYQCPQAAEKGEPTELVVTACYFPHKGEAELSWERGEHHFGMTVKVTPEQGSALADVVWPCIPWRATATRSDNWRKYAKEGETAQDVIERERADSAALCKLLEEARASQAEPVAWLRDQRDNYEGRETLDPILILGRTNPGKGINGATYSPVVLAASQAERPAGFVLVPVEPTPEMCKAGEVCWGDPDSGPWATYERMLAAAAPSGGQQK